MHDKKIADIVYAALPVNLNEGTLDCVPSIFSEVVS